MTTLSEIDEKLVRANNILKHADKILDAIKVEQEGLGELIDLKREQLDTTDCAHEYARLFQEIEALKERGWILIRRIWRVSNIADYHGKMAAKFAIESLGGTFHGSPIQEKQAKATPNAHEG